MIIGVQLLHTFCIILQAHFEYLSKDYENQLLMLIGRRDKRGLIVINPAQTMFLFCDMHHMQVCVSLTQDDMVGSSTPPLKV